MKKMAMLAGAALATAVTMASAQYNGRGDGYADRPDWRANADQDCWNPRAGHYERVRPNEVQDDLDFRRCRPVGNGNEGAARYDQRRDGWQDRRDDRRDNRQEECWNSNQNHYEVARRGEYQGDLDYSRCRIQQ